MHMSMYKEVMHSYTLLAFFLQNIESITAYAIRYVHLLTQCYFYAKYV